MKQEYVGKGTVVEAIFNWKFHVICGPLVKRLLLHFFQKEFGGYAGNAELAAGYGIACRC